MRYISTRPIPTKSDLPFGPNHSFPHARAYEAMHTERIRAHAKHDLNNGSMERELWYSPRWMSVVVEETGEVARAICEFDLENTSRIQFRESLRGELVQLGAMVAAWIDAIDHHTDQ
jgi:NTP pyrophosphatase (non-canonical NTP hydrolase)